MDERTVVAMHALSAMRLYHPVFPSDKIPFQAIAAAMKLGNDPLPPDYFTEFEAPIRQRLLALDTLNHHNTQSRGWLCAAAEALHLTMMAMVNDPQPVEADRVRQAAFAMVTDLGFSFV